MGDGRGPLQPAGSLPRAAVGLAEVGWREWQRWGIPGRRVL